MSELSLEQASKLLDVPRLRERLPELRPGYAEADPFPHVVIDEFLSPANYRELLLHLPEGSQEMRRRPRNVDLEDGRPAQMGKRNYAEGEVAPLVQMMFWQLNSFSFLEFLTELTGIEDLISDPALRGSGIHMTGRGGLLRVHADFNKHPFFDLDRRINFLLYLNEDWSEDYGGELELWNSDVSECRQRIAPRPNRCVIFNTSSTSFHGHPEPLTCPENVFRRSMAMYYYTNGRPESEANEKHATLWPNLPGES